MKITIPPGAKIELPEEGRWIVSSQEDGSVVLERVDHDGADERIHEFIPKGT